MAQLVDQGRKDVECDYEPDYGEDYSWEDVRGLEAIEIFGDAEELVEVGHCWGWRGRGYGARRFLGKTRVFALRLRG